MVRSSFTSIYGGYTMRLFLSLFVVSLFFSYPVLASQSIIDPASIEPDKEKSSQPLQKREDTNLPIAQIKEATKVVTSDDLKALENSDSKTKNITLSGTIYKGDWRKLTLFPELENLSLKFVNQISLKPEAHCELLSALEKLTKLKNLDLTLQFIDDDFLEKIPNHVQELNVSKTPILGFGLGKFKNKNVRINVDGTLVDKSEYPDVTFF